MPDAKLQIPLPRPGIVVRSGLVDRLVAADGPSVISVAAPPGYGKTTLLAQLAEHQQPRVGWLSADRRDNDPAVLLTYLAAALDRIEPLDRAVVRALASRGAGVASVPFLVDALLSMDGPAILVIDQADEITSPESLDILTELALSVPDGSRLAVASRHRFVPAARLRARRSLLEVGADDLAMDAAEADELLRRADLDLADSDVVDLVERTEGWPAGLYLAALAAKSGGATTGISFAGDDRFVGDYLRAEFLEGASRSEVAFLTRTSILDRMCGPLCDAVVGRRRSGDMLEGLEERNLLVVPLDHRREWYRYHNLFRELLQAQLRRREPETVPTLHARAAAWYEASSMPEAAIDHAQAAGDAASVARIVLQVMQPVWASGQVDTVLRWMEWLEEKTWVEHYAAIATHGSLIYALLGQPGAAERWAAAAERGASTGVLSDGSTVEATLAYLRALRGCDGVEQMRADARVALAGLSPSSPYRATMLQTEGVADVLEGDLERGEQNLAHATDVAIAAGAVPFVPFVLAQRGMVAIQRDDWSAADVLAEQAHALISGGEFDEYWTSALVYAWLAHVAAHRREVDEARQHLARAARLRPLLTYALPVASTQALLEMARSYLALADPQGARAVSRQAEAIFRQRPALGRLTVDAAEIRRQIDAGGAGSSGASSLTAAELRLLPLLPTHLSLREIGERLYVSRHTVKSQAIAVYRKLGVSSRSDAITKMRELGLLIHD